MQGYEARQEPEVKQEKPNKGKVGGSAASLQQQK